MSDDFYPFVDSGDPAPDNEHLNGIAEPPATGAPTPQATTDQQPEGMYATRIAVYDDMLSTPRVIVIEPKDVRTYLEETTNTVYRCMKEQGGGITLMVIREIVENFIHAHFAEPIISILDGGNTIRFADQGPGIEDKERAFEFGVTSANRGMKRYIRGTGAGFPMVQQYLENKGGAVSIEDNMGQGTVVTVSIDPARVAEIEAHGARGAAVRASEFSSAEPVAAQQASTQPAAPQVAPGIPQPMATPDMNQMAANPYGMPQQAQGAYPQQMAPGYPYPYPYSYPAWPQMPQQQMQQAQGAAQQGMAADPSAWQNPYAAWPGIQPQTGYQQIPPAYPQQMGQFSTNQQIPASSVYPNVQNPLQTASEPFVSERGHEALSYLGQNGQCGPTELMKAWGSSVPTWSRELVNLCESGLVIKRGQKFHLTELGRNWVQNHG